MVRYSYRDRNKKIRLIGDKLVDDGRARRHHESRVVAV